MSRALHLLCPRCRTPNRLPVARLGDHPRCGHCKQALFQSAPIELDAAGFQRHLRHNDIPLLVDFWAPWCGPCKTMAPHFQQAAARLEPGVRLVKINTETEQALAAHHAIRSIPTLVLFKDGREIARQAGAMDLQALLRWVKARL